jgi:hypothetical protein
LKIPLSGVNSDSMVIMIPLSHDSPESMTSHDARLYRKNFVLTDLVASTILLGFDEAVSMTLLSLDSAV